MIGALAPLRAHGPFFAMSPAVSDRYVEAGAEFLSWMAVAGGLLVGVALCSVYLRRLSISTSAVYLALGVVLGPLGTHWLQPIIDHESRWFEYLTQVAVIVSLFMGGLKLRAPFEAKAWRTVPLLAGPIMLASIVGVAVFARVALRLDGASCLLLGSVLAPTDPVLASSVSVSEAADRDRMRYGLSGEAGLNDGMAFPFVVFAMDWITHRGPGTWILGWAVVHVLWATPIALAVGYALGWGLGHVTVYLRVRHRDVSGPNDLLALGLIALAYVAAEMLHAWGFLAVFAAGVGLRRAESAIVLRSPHPDARLPATHPPAEDLVAAKLREDAVEQPAVAVGAVVADTLAFGRTAERLLELLLVVLVGASLGRAGVARRILPVRGASSRVGTCVSRADSDHHRAAMAHGMVRYSRHWKPVLRGVCADACAFVARPS